MRRRKKLLVTTITAAILILAAASFVFADFMQNSKPINDVSGTVTFRYGGGYFLKAENGKEYKLVVGPYWYLDQLGLKLKVGDKITVDGALDENDNVLFVSTLKKGARTYQIADPDKVLDDSYCHRPGEKFMGRRGHPRGRYVMGDDRPMFGGKNSGKSYGQRNINNQ